MAAISGIEGVFAPQHPGAQTRQEKGGSAAVDFGGAVTHSELVEAKLRVDPAALADKARKPDQTRKREEPPRESSRQQRFAEDDAAYDAKREEPGANVDISV